MILSYIYHVYIFFPPYITQNPPKVFVYFEKKAAAFDGCLCLLRKRDIDIDIYYIYIYSIVNPIYKYISSQLFFWHSFLLIFAFFSSFCLHFSASQLLAVIYNVEWGDFADVNWNWMAPKKIDFPMEKKSLVFLSMASRFLCRPFRATTLNSVSSVHNNNQG